MHKSKIKFFSIYNTLSETEKSEFKLLISSPLFNKGKRNYTAILSGIESDILSDSEFTESSKKRNLWNRLSELTKLAERFLVLKGTETENFSYELILLKELRKRNLNKHFEKRFTKIKTEVDKSLFSVSKVKNLMELNNLYLDYLDTKDDSIKFADGFQKLIDFKTALFIFELLDQMVNVWEMKHTKVMDANVDLEEFFKSIDINNLLKFVKEKVPILYPMTAFHYHIYNSLKFPLNHLHYQKAKEIFNKERNLLSEEYRLNLYRSLMEYNIQRRNLQEEGSSEELFEIINQKLEEGLYEDIQTEDFRKNNFRNYLLNSLVLEKFEWAQMFIEKFGTKLPEEIRNDTISLSKALLMYHQKKYPDALKFLSHSKTVNSVHYVDISILTLKIYYELSEFEECFNELRRLLEYIRKERNVQGDFINYVKDFCVVFRLLLKIRQEPTNKNLIDLKYELKKRNLTGAKWLKKKIEEVLHSS